MSNRLSKGDNYYKDPYYDIEPDDIEEELPEPGPLSRMPSARNFRPAVFCVILFYIASVLYSDYSIGDKLWASGQTVFNDHEYWRLVTSVFTHFDMLHLLSNSFIFLLFGWLLRSYFGLFIFPLLSILIGTATTFLCISLYEPYTRLMGSSGMNYGMVSLWLVFYLRYDIDHGFAIKILRTLGFIMAMMLPSAISPQTSYLAHAIGFLAGIVTGLFLLPFIKVRDPK